MSSKKTIIKKKKVSPKKKAPKRLIAPRKKISKRAVKTKRVAKTVVTQPSKSHLIQPRLHSMTHRLKVFIGYHRFSPHIIRLKKPYDNLSISPTTPEEWPTYHSWLFRCCNEISILSLLVGIFWLGVSLGRVVFRVPLPKNPQLKKIVWQPDFSKYKSRSLEPDVKPRWDTLSVDQPKIATIKTRKDRENYAYSITPFKTIVSRAASFGVMSFFIVSLLSATAVFAQIPNTKKHTIDAASAGVEDFVLGGQAVIARDFTTANFYFKEATQYFIDAENGLNTIPPILRRLAELVPLTSSLKSGSELLRAGAALSRAGSEVSSAFHFLSGDQSKDPIQSIGANFFWEDIQRSTSLIQQDLNEANDALNNVSEADLPESYRSTFAKVEQSLPLIKSAVHELLIMERLAPIMLGIDSRERYLVVFQNSNELRPTGGFMGSFAVVQVDRGKWRIVSVPSGGSYDLEGSLKPRLLAPSPLQLINTRWEFQDANWWLDWPTSAQKIAWFYSNAGGETVDGVIGITTQFVENLLAITGPISIPGYDFVITAENFTRLTEETIKEQALKDPKNPKQIITDLTPELMRRLEAISQENVLPLASVLSQSLREKNILLYSTDGEVLNGLKHLGWLAEVPALPQYSDTLSVVHTNIAGGKTDGAIDNEVRHSVALENDGRLVDTVVLTRAHNGVKGDPFSGVRNVDYLRFYVPAGARLISASGFVTPPSDLFKIPTADLLPDEDLEKISKYDHEFVSDDLEAYDEFNRTVFAGWLMTDPGQSSKVELKYELPWRAQTINSAGASWLAYLGWSNNVENYRFFWQKQPGAKVTKFIHEFVSATPLIVIQSNDALQNTGNGWQWQKELKSDADLEVVFKN